MTNPIAQAILFITDTLFTFYIVTILLRFCLQWVKADFYNPVCQFIIKVTNPVLLPLRRFIPGWFGLDWASLLAMLALSFINQLIFVLIGLGKLKLLGTLILAFGDLLSMTFYIYFFGLLILVIASWLAPFTHNPVMQTLYQLLHPGLMRIQRRIPPISGFDLSPLFLSMALILFNILIVGPVKALGYGLLVN